jgi:glycosyltransferase involved in cell wall biosynthesis
MGADVLLAYLYRLRPDYLVTLADAWWLTFLTDPGFGQFFEMTATHWAMYFPLDGHRPNRTLPASWIEILRRADLPIAMSRYGRDLVRANGLNCEYIPHGVDTASFHPAADHVEAKRRLGYEGRFVVLSDARNQPRKMLPRLLTIFDRFARGRPDALLHLHCDPHDPAAGEDRYSYSIDEDVRALGLQSQVRFTRNFAIGNGLPLTSLVEIYQAADVHALVSQGEGFGLPTLQAAACGVVPIAADYSANVELLAEHGLPLRVADYVCDEFGIGRAFVDVEDAKEVLIRLYDDREALADRSRRAREFALKYDWDRVLPQWDSLLRERAASGHRAARAPHHSAHSVRSLRVGGEAGGMLGAPLLAPLPARVGVAPCSEAVRITVTMREQRLGEMASLVVNDAQRDPGSPGLNVPIVRTTQSALGPDTRPVARVHVVENGTVPRASASVFLALRAIFPVLQRTSADNAAAADAELLSECVLVIDIDADDDARRHAALGRVAARLGLPLIGRADFALYRSLWPELAVDDGDPIAAVRIARNVLSDPLFAAEVTTRARASLGASVMYGAVDARVAAVGGG